MSCCQYSYFNFPFNLFNRFIVLNPIIHLLEFFLLFAVVPEGIIRDVLGMRQMVALTPVRNASTVEDYKLVFLKLTARSRES